MQTKTENKYKQQKSNKSELPNEARPVNNPIIVLGQFISQQKEPPGQTNNDKKKKELRQTPSKSRPQPVQSKRKRDRLEKSSPRSNKKDKTGLNQNRRQPPKTQEPTKQRSKKRAFPPAPEPPQSPIQEKKEEEENELKKQKTKKNNSLLQFLAGKLRVNKSRWFANIFSDEKEKKVLRYNFQCWGSEFAFAKNSLFFLDEKNCFRMFVVKLKTSKWFTGIILFLVMVHALLFCFQDYSSRIGRPVNFPELQKFIDSFELLFLIVYTAEGAIKVRNTIMKLFFNFFWIFFNFSNF